MYRLGIEMWLGKFRKYRKYLRPLSLLAGIGIFCCSAASILTLRDLFLVFLCTLILAVFKAAWRAKTETHGWRQMCKDGATSLATPVFWLNLINQIRLVLVVLSIFSLMAPITDPLQPSDLLLLHSRWVGFELFPTLYFLTLMCRCVEKLDQDLDYIDIDEERKYMRQSSIRTSCAWVCVYHLLMLGALAIDYVIVGLGLIIVKAQIPIPYFELDTGWTYHKLSRTGDQFEWRRQYAWPCSFRFKDTYFLFSQLLLAGHIVCSAVVWFYLLAKCYSRHTRAISRTQLDLGILWFEYLVAAFCLNAMAGCGFAFRAFIHMPGDATGWQDGP